MKKVIGQTFFAFFLLLSYTAVGNTSPLPRLKTTLSYKFLKPILSAIGYRPISIHVYDEASLAPLSGATVMIGEGENSPFEHNWTQTDLNGNATFDGFLLSSGPQTITVRHRNYSGYTIFQTEANGIEIPLTRLEDLTPKTTVTGSLTNWPERMEDFDDIVHVGFLLPFIDVASMIDFNLDKLLAPNVKAFIYKDMEVPGNVVLPSQEERYLGFISVYMSKPEYQIPLATGSNKNLIALAGELPFSTLVKGFLDKKPFAELINLVSLTQYGLALNYTVPVKNEKMTIALSDALASKFNVQTPAAPENKDIAYISLSSFKKEMNFVFPLDFKLSPRNETMKKALLKSLYSREHLPPLQDLIIAIAVDFPKDSESRRKIDNAITGAVKRPSKLEFNIGFDSFLSLHDLSYENNSTFSYKIRNALPEKAVPHMNLSFINRINPGEKGKERRERTWWTVLSPASANQFTLPKLPEGLSEFPKLTPREELSWALTRIGLSDKNYEFNYDHLDPENFSQHLTHFSRNQLTLIAPQEFSDEQNLE